MLTQPRAEIGLSEVHKVAEWKVLYVVIILVIQSLFFWRAGDLISISLSLILLLLNKYRLHPTHHNNNEIKNWGKSVLPADLDYEQKSIKYRYWCEQDLVRNKTQDTKFFTITTP